MVRHAWLAVLSALLLPLAARADEFERLVGYRCDTGAGELLVTYRGAWNEAGEAMLATRTPTEWSPLDLVQAADEDHYGDSKVVEARCVLRQVAYRIRLGASPQNRRMDGQCGAVIGAWAEVTAGADATPFRRELEPWCHSDDPVVTRIAFRPASREPVVTSVAQDEFFK